MENYLDAKGRIFDIQKYSIHDGPGIRTIVFLKGCALRCRWCCNPESQEFDVQPMMFEGKEKIMGKDVTVAELMPIILQDRFYYVRSGGGLTLSGGESLLQPDFAPHLLRASKELEINTAIETTGFAKWETIQKYLPYLDYVLMDIKHMNSAKHKEFTRQPNELILENARKIAESGMVNLTILPPKYTILRCLPRRCRVLRDCTFSRTTGSVRASTKAWAESILWATCRSYRTTICSCFWKMQKRAV